MLQIHTETTLLEVDSDGSHLIIALHSNKILVFGDSL